jgi:hypothetical protein
MKAFLVAAAVALSAFVAPGPAAAQTQDVLAPARAGQLLCFAPNALRRTCSALASYTLREDGAYVSQAQILIAREPVIIMIIASLVAVRDNAVCGPMTSRHVERALFAIDGQRASDDNAVYLREQVTAMPGFLGNDVCTRHVTAANGLRAEYTNNGASSGEGVQMLWVRPDEGYRVAP